MMSTLNSSQYRQHIDDTTHHYRSRPVVVGAPYVLCVFVVGVVLMGVGTFVTSHGHQRDPPDPVLLFVGPGLLGLGGLLLLGSVLVCTVACCRNYSLRESLSDELLTIGASTFYGGKRLAPDEDEEALDHVSKGGVTNPAGPDHAQAVMILAKTVADERDRQRKESQKYTSHFSHEALDGCLVARGHPYLANGTMAHGYSLDVPLDSLGRSNPPLLDHLGLEQLRRAEVHPHLTQDLHDFPDTDDSGYGVRERAYSVSTRRLAPVASVQNRLRRNVTYTPASRARILRQQQQRQHQEQLLHSSQLLHVPEEQQQQQQQQQQPSPHPGPQRKRSSRRRKASRQSTEKTPSPAVQVHQLPQYDPDLLHALGLVSGRPKLSRGISEEGILDHSHSHNPQHHLGNRREDLDATNGSLGNPRRRPSVVMGVSGKQKQAQQTQLMTQQTNAAYRRTSILYASDMDLHRSTSGLPRSCEPRSPSDPATDNFATYTETDGMTSRTGSSPNILLPPPESSTGLCSPHLVRSRDFNDKNSDAMQQDSRSGKPGDSDDNTLLQVMRGTPSTSLPSSPSASLRPVSNISSESCCSDCCQEDEERESKEEDHDRVV